MLAQFSNVGSGLCEEPPPGMILNAFSLMLRVECNFHSCVAESIMGRRKTIKSSVTSPSMSDEPQSSSTPHHPKSGEEALRLSQALRSQYLFDHLQEDQLAMVVDACFPVSVKAGEIIVEEVGF
jgi:hypothetical protein